MNPVLPRITPLWLVPTARATTWTPLALVAGAMIGVSVVCAALGRWPLDLLGVTCAALAAAAVAGLRDPAAALLDAVPTSPARRRAHRLGLLVPAVLVAWLTCLALARTALAGSDAAGPDGVGPVGVELGWPVGPVAALTVFGVAVRVWAPRRVAITLGAAAPAFWVLASTATTGLLGSPDGWKDDLVYAWNDRPWLVTALAVTAIVTRRTR